MPALLLPLLALVAAVPVVVEADGDCPGAAAIAHALAALVPQVSTEEAAAQARVMARRGPDGVVVRVYSAAGVELGRRALDVTAASCDEAAALAAIVAASLLSDVDPRFAVALATPPPEPPPPTPARVVATPTRPLAAPPPPVSPAPAPVAARTKAAPAPVAANPGADPAAPVAWLGLAARLGAVSDTEPGGRAPGFAIEGAYFPVGGAAALHAGLSWTEPSARSLELGEVSWRRLAVETGLTLRARPITARLQPILDLGVVLGALHYEGRDFSRNYSGVAFDPGMLAQLRLGFRASRWLPFVGISSRAFSRAHRLRTRSEDLHLPRFEVLFTAGVLFAGIAPEPL